MVSIFNVFKQYRVKKEELEAATDGQMNQRQVNKLNDEVWLIWRAQYNYTNWIPQKEAMNTSIDYIGNR